jgi:dTDP-4-dehydrorhamnose reductase
MVIIVLGGTGMVGSTVSKVLSRNKDLEVYSTYRRIEDARWMRDYRLTPVQHHPDIAAGDALPNIGRCFQNLIINCVGLTKQLYYGEHMLKEMFDANTLLPSHLRPGSVNRDHESRVIHISTDCVFDGRRGKYVEDDPVSPTDYYGMTKAMGEFPDVDVKVIRCSLIGPQLQDHTSLLEWFCTHNEHSEVPGYTNHYWNGLTTLHFARICRALVNLELWDETPNLLHMIPPDSVTKEELLQLFNKHFKKDFEVKIKPQEQPERRDMTLDTKHPDAVKKIWGQAGYQSPPSISRMVQELRTWILTEEPA